MQQWIPAAAAPHATALPATADPLAFAPVPRKYRFDGWTVERQRAFIAALAETGSVKAACQRVNLATTGAYHLRRQPGAESFRAAWEAALASGVQRLADIAIDRAIEGTPVPVFYHGEQVGERRRYNDRLLMFIMKHHMPGRYGAAALPAGTKHPDTLAREAAAACPVCKERAKEDAKQAEIAAEDVVKSKIDFANNLLRLYEQKVAAERRERIAGNMVGADFYLRQLSYWELILDGCGHRPDLIELYTTREGRRPGDVVEVCAGPINRILDEIRREIWEAAGEPPRPPLDLRERFQWSGYTGGPTLNERERAREEAQRRIAAGQAMWEACANEETWARFKEAL